MCTQSPDALSAALGTCTSPPSRILIARTGGKRVDAALGDVGNMFLRIAVYSGRPGVPSGIESTIEGAEGSEVGADDASVHENEYEGQGFSERAGF